MWFNTQDFGDVKAGFQPPPSPEPACPRTLFRGSKGGRALQACFDKLSMGLLGLAGVGDACFYALPPSAICGPSTSAIGTVVTASAATSMSAVGTPAKSLKHAEDERRRRSRRAAQRIEEAIAAALAVVAHELGDGAVEHRRRAVERHAHGHEQQHGPAQRREHHRGDQGTRRQLRQDDGAQDADTLGDQPAHELAGGAADEDEREAEADARHARAFGDQQEREEREEACAAGAVDELDGAEQREAGGIGETPARGRCRRGLRARRIVWRGPRAPRP